MQCNIYFFNKWSINQKTNDWSWIKNTYSNKRYASCVVFFKFAFSPAIKAIQLFWNYLLSSTRIGTMAVKRVLFTTFPEQWNCPVKVLFRCGIMVICWQPEATFLWPGSFVIRIWRTRPINICFSAKCDSYL